MTRKNWPQLNKSRICPASDKFFALGMKDRKDHLTP